MNLVEIAGNLYNLDQLVSVVTARPQKVEWHDDDDTLEVTLTFVGGITFRLPATEQESIYRLIRAHSKSPAA